jgi:hypothetical protein
MTLLTYCNEENRMNRVVSVLLARNSFGSLEIIGEILFLNMRNV